MLMVCFTAISQIENKSTIVDWRQHNLTQYNKFLVNPTYSIIRNNHKAVSFWSRIQWTGVDNSPQTYMLSYAGKVGENSGAGLGLYQQSLGLLVDSGLLVNYAYNVQIAEEVSLAFGVNTTLFRRGLDKNTANSVDPDPAVLDNKDDFLLVFMPGFNVSIKNFDLGVYAENFFDYNFNDSKSLTDFSNKIFSGQLGYTKELEYANGMFLDATWRTLVYGKTLPNEDFQYGLNTMIDLPYTGWMQVGYNNAFGISGGLGVRVGDGISIGIVYENGNSKTNKAFGSTYEAIATIELGSRLRRKNQLETDGKAMVSKGVDQNNFITSEEIIRSRADSLNSNQEIPSEEYIEETGAITDTLEINDQTSKYAVYGVTDENSQVAQKTDYQQSEDSIMPNADQKSSNAMIPAKPVDNTAESGLTTFKSSKSTGDDLKVVKDIEKQPEIPSEEMAEIEVAYQEFLKRSDSVAANYTPKTIDSTAVTAEVFGTQSSYRTLNAIQGVDKGFYLVLNVFSSQHYFENFIADLKQRGFDPKFFINPENNYYYVYLHKANRYIAIKNLQRNNVNQTYFEDKWVLWVK